LKIIIDKFHKESQQITRKSNVLRENIEKIQYLAAPLGRLNGTPVENHCPRLMTLPCLCFKTSVLISGNEFEKQCLLFGLQNMNILDLSVLIMNVSIFCRPKSPLRNPRNVWHREEALEKET